MIVVVIINMADNNHEIEYKPSDLPTHTMNPATGWFAAAAATTATTDAAAAAAAAVIRSTTRQQLQQCVYFQL